MKLIFEKTVPQRRALELPAPDTDTAPRLEEKLLRESDADLPQISELDVVRHFTELSNLNFSVDRNFYPLGSCTMKYNPKVTEVAANLKGFRDLHPYLPYINSGEEYVQGALGLIFELQQMLSEITGMDMTTCQPLAGAHGELTGILIIKAYHSKKGNIKKHIIVPDASHGTNPASAQMAGYEVVTIPFDDKGQMDINAFKEKLSDETAAVILTCPNTLGIFNRNIKEICDLAHSVDALMYYDGANMNAILGKVKPGDIGFDMVHINLHKTFATPHGGGGPGAGPVGVKKNLTDFLPAPYIVMKNDNTYTLSAENPISIGRIAPFYGNFSVLVKAFTYIKLLGKDGLENVSDMAVLNANYIRNRLKKHYKLPYDSICMHECVFSASKQVANGIHAVDIAKFLIDRGIHPPTVYFPLIVKDAIMIEPTETESKETLDDFIDVMIEAAGLGIENPQVLLNTPVTRTVIRLDEVRAARELDTNFNPHDKNNLAIS
ncbi:MAG: aminomethyl-transferring glycine dehydrogenase subunit GcvPB [Elusimicrobiota bacterium]